jgi:hypothetical protein
MLLLQHKLQKERKMKKIAIFVFVLIMTAGFVMAQDSGFSVGAEAGIIYFPDDNDSLELLDLLYTMPTLSYKGFLMNDALELSAELGVPFWIKPELWLGVDFGLNLEYKLGPLSLLVENQLSIPVMKNEDVYPSVYPYSPLLNKGGHFLARSFFFWPRSTISETYDILSPGVKYSLLFNTGDIYLQADLPIRFMPDAFDYAGFNLSLGWKGENGFGIKIKEYNYLKRPGSEDKFFQRVDLAASYDTGSFYGELEVGVPMWENAMDSLGVTIIPKVEFGNANGFKVYGNIPIYRLGSNSDLTFGVAIGVKKSF